MFGFTRLGFLLGWWVRGRSLVVESDGVAGGIRVGLSCR